MHLFKYYFFLQGSKDNMKRKEIEYVNGTLTLFEESSEPVLEDITNGPEKTGTVHVYNMK